MEFQISQEQKAKASSRFLAWVKEAVDLDQPVFITKHGGKIELSTALKNMSIGLQLGGVKDEEITTLARLGESTARLDKALREKATIETMDHLKNEYQNIWQKFRQSREEFSQKYGITENEMLSIFKAIT